VAVPAWQALGWADVWGGHVRNQVRIEILSGLAAAVNDSNRQIAGTVLEVARIFEQGVGAEVRTRAHRTLAEDAQASILKSYDQVVTRRKGPAGFTNYRAKDFRKVRNQRLAGGILRRALGSRRMISYDEDGFAFINVDVLDAEAAHWARLNAGAGRAGRGSRRRFQVEFSGLVAGSFGADMAPSAAFLIPRGYWWEPGGGPAVAPGGAPPGSSEFYPLGEGPRHRNTGTGTMRGREGRVGYQKPRMTGGIEARNFLDAGYQTVADKLGDTYERMYRELWRRRAATVKPRRFSYGVTNFHAYGRGSG
jgi:hypothetical protein